MTGMKRRAMLEGGHPWGRHDEDRIWKKFSSAFADWLWERLEESYNEGTYEALLSAVPERQ